MLCRKQATRSQEVRSASLFFQASSSSTVNHLAILLSIFGSISSSDKLITSRNVNVSSGDTCYKSCMRIGECAFHKHKIHWKLSISITVPQISCSTCPLVITKPVSNWIILEKGELGCAQSPSFPFGKSHALIKGSRKRRT